MFLFAFPYCGWIPLTPRWLCVLLSYNLQFISISNGQEKLWVFEGPVATLAGMISPSLKIASDYKTIQSTPFEGCSALQISEDCSHCEALHTKHWAKNQVQ